MTNNSKRREAIQQEKKNNIGREKRNKAPMEDRKRR